MRTWGAGKLNSGTIAVGGQPTEKTCLDRRAVVQSLSDKELI